MCDADRVEELLSSKWGFNVNREFGEVDMRAWSCVHYATLSWVKNDQNQARDTTTVDNSAACKKTLQVLRTKPDFDLDHRGDAGENALDLAYRHDNFGVADYLVQEHLKFQTLY